MKTKESIRKDIQMLVQEYASLAYAGETFKPGVSHVPTSGKVLGSKELEYMVEASLDGWLTTGRFNAKFQAGLAGYMGVKYVLTVNSGSSANLVAFSALTAHELGDRAIRCGDEVITVAAGFPTTLNPILLSGAVPVFVDVTLPTYNIDVKKIESAISEKTKAVMLAHTLGNPFNLDVVLELCKKHRLWLIEDCCDALGSTYRGKCVGTFGDIATLSFYPAHHMTMGEGGAVCTNNPQLRKIMESLRDWGRDCYCAPGRDNTCGKRFEQRIGDLPYGYDHKYTYSHLGYNLKIGDIQAACGLAQMDRLVDFIGSRKNNFSHLKQALKGTEEVFILPEACDNSDPAWFGFPITIRESSGLKRTELLQFLDQKRIGTRLLFGGNLIRQPYMKGRVYRISGDLRNTDKIMNNTFWVGIFPGLNHEMLDYVATTLKQYLREKN